MSEKSLLQYVHHVHYVVQNRDAMVEYLAKNFGMKPDQLVESENGTTKDALYSVGKTDIEISEPLDPKCKIAQHMAKHGPGVFHVAWAVENIEKVVKDLATKGNKMAGKEGVGLSSLGYKTSNIETSSSHGVWFQLAEGERISKR